MVNQVNITLEGGFDVPLPPMVKIRQIFDAPVIEDIEAAVAEQIKKDSIKERVKPGARIAVAVGSRGIANISRITKALVDNLKELGANPIIVPAMGSHGGATAEGQREVLATYNITEETMGVPIESSMEVVEIAKLENGYPVYLDKIASECDAIIPVNRVKPHTDFKGDYESGLLKMLSIGLGKHKGAAKIHTQGFSRFNRLIPALGQEIINNSKVIFGLAILENAYDETAKIVSVEAEKICQEEIQLLAEAKAMMPKLLMSSIDVLIVNEIGKNISGNGMDPNITGRNVSGEPGFFAPPIKKIVVLGLTEETHGNACGIGTADITTIKVVNSIDFTYTFNNVITSTELGGGKIPVFVNTDKEAIAVAVRCSNLVEPPDVKIVRINNTLELNEIEVSLPVLEELRGRPDIEIISEPYTMEFDKEGNLL
ncbi:MAG: lactate racemase domain-containing protein [Bacillota bacterium]